MALGPPQGRGKVSGGAGHFGVDRHRPILNDVADRSVPRDSRLMGALLCGPAKLENQLADLGPNWQERGRNGEIRDRLRDEMRMEEEAAELAETGEPRLAENGGIQFGRTEEPHWAERGFQLSLYQCTTPLPQNQAAVP